LIAWETLRWRGVLHLQERWSARVLATVVGVLVTMLVLDAIFSHDDGYRLLANLSNVLAIATYAVWAWLTMWVYRRKVKDLFVLAGWVLSLIITTNAFLTRLVVNHMESVGFLMVSLMIIGSSALGGMWLKKVMKEMQA
jgi:ABC-type iron transport system FetAB permease component